MDAVFRACKCGSISMADSLLAMQKVGSSSLLYRSNATDKALAYEPEPISGRRNPLYHEGRR